MIENIVFDMGRVLVGYDADRVCRHFMEDPEERREVRSSVFVSPEWIMLDLGIVTEEYALGKMQERLDTLHAKEMAKLCMEHWPEYNIWPITQMGEVVRLLKERGYGIYLCSNASKRYDEYLDLIPGLKEFDGLLFSADVHYIKPQRDIYEALFRKFDLKPETCFFIDDMEINVEGARACGMDGYCFADGNVEMLKRALMAL